MNYQELHTYITTVQAMLNSLHIHNPPGAPLATLRQIKRITDRYIRKAL